MLLRKVTFGYIEITSCELRIFAVVFNNLHLIIIIVTYLYTCT